MTTEKIQKGPMEIFTPLDVGERLKVSPGTLAKWRSQGAGPRFYKIGGLVRYSDLALEEWLRSAEADRKNKLS